MCTDQTCIKTILGIIAKVICISYKAQGTGHLKCMYNNINVVL